MKKRIIKKKIYQILFVINFNAGDIVPNLKLTPLRSKKLFKYAHRLRCENKLMENLGEWIRRGNMNIIERAQKEKWIQ